MADISMCVVKSCPKRKSCYRQTANASQWQSYEDFRDICNKENNYECYWKDDRYNK